MKDDRFFKRIIITETKICLEPHTNGISFSEFYGRDLGVKAKMLTVFIFEY